MYIKSGNKSSFILQMDHLLGTKNELNQLLWSLHHTNGSWKKILTLMH